MGRKKNEEKTTFSNDQHISTKITPSLAQCASLDTMKLLEWEKEVVGDVFKG